MKKNLSSLLFGALLPLLLLSSCEEIDVDSDTIAVTQGVSDKASTRAVVSCLANVEQQEPFTNIRLGVMYSTNKADLEALTGHTSYTSEMEGNKYKVTLAPLLPNTEYFYRALVGVNQITNYGRIKSFKTEKKKTSIPEFVDLGLPSGTLWATMNLGAESPEDYGDYFAWGETAGNSGGKSAFYWSNYFWCYGTEKTITKYCNNKDYGALGFVDTLTELELSDDAANAIWGKEWRIPSHKQTEELFNSKYTVTEWTTMKGVKGLKVMSTSNGKSIFLPAAGIYTEVSLDQTNTQGYYWSRTLDPNGCIGAWTMTFASSFRGTNGGITRERGLSIRPVRSAE